DEYELTYTLKNAASGETKKMTDKEYMDQKVWEDESWEIVGEPTSVLVKKGYQLAIPDLNITDAEGNQVTEQVIQNPYYNFIVVSSDVTKLSPLDYVAFDKINQTTRAISAAGNIRAVLFTASSSADAASLNAPPDLILEIFYAVAAPSNSMVSSTPGVMLMQTGTVVKKWSKNSFPTKEELIEKYLK